MFNKFVYFTFILAVDHVCCQRLSDMSVVQQTVLRNTVIIGKTD